MGGVFPFFLRGAVSLFRFFSTCFASLLCGVACFSQNMPTRLPPGVLPARHWVVREDMPIEKLASRLSANSYHSFEVMDAGMRPMGQLDESTLLRNLLDHPGTTVGESMVRRNGATANRDSTVP